MRLAKYTHPDVHAYSDRAAAEVRFKELQASYELLTGRRQLPSSPAEAAAARARAATARARAAEPFLIRWFWRGPSVGTKLKLKLFTMAALLVAGLVDEPARRKRSARRGVASAAR